MRQRPTEVLRQWVANASRRRESFSCVWSLSQLIRGGFDSIINLIFRLFFSKRKLAITLEDPNIKYALRLLDKQVTSLKITHINPELCKKTPLSVHKRSRCVQAPLLLCGCILTLCSAVFFKTISFVIVACADCQSWHEEVPLCPAFPWTRPRSPYRSVWTPIFINIR